MPDNPSDRVPSSLPANDGHQGEGADDSERTDRLLGTTLAGRFRIVEPIARGGMGMVYKAEQLALGRTCAVKVLRPSFDADQNAEFHRRFFLEASTAAKLTHPNTVTIFDYGNANGVYFIAMEYIVGRSLRAVLRDEGPLEPTRALRIASQVCRSVQEAHGLGIVHRDLKPDNIVVLKDHAEDHDSIKVLDFGLVKEVGTAGAARAESLTGSALGMGSPSYMAPEQVEGSDVTPAADVYSMGIVMYEMLCGRPPFIKNSNYALMMAHLSETPAPMTDHLPSLDLPPSVSQIVERCLHKNPTERFANMSELLDALRQIVDPRDASRGRLALTKSGSMPAVGMPSTSGSIPAVAGVPCSTTGSVRIAFAEEPAKPSRPRSRVLPITVLAGVAAVSVAMVLLVFKGGDAAPEKLAGVPPAATSTSPPATSTEPVQSAPAITATASAPGDTFEERVTRIVTDPGGAAVMLEDVVLCKPTPCEVTWTGKNAAPDKEHALTIKLWGYAPARLKASPSQSKVAVTLFKIEAPKPTPPPPTRQPGFGFKDAPY